MPFLETRTDSEMRTKGYLNAIVGMPAGRRTPPPSDLLFSEQSLVSGGYPKMTKNKSNNNNLLVYDLTASPHVKKGGGEMNE